MKVDPDGGKQGVRMKPFDYSGCKVVDPKKWKRLMPEEKKRLSELPPLRFQSLEVDTVSISKPFQDLLKRD